MSISFNGLASGLDTSSWVESLTALKRAKITSLQQEKEAITLSKDTLSSIKSFFNSFRNVVQKITDTKFNVGTMDVFAQNITNSSNLKVLTATATANAQEGSYDISVEKLATNTKATSGYNSIVSVDQEITATESTLLSKLGIKAGNFKIGTSTITITSSDTIGSLTTKLGNAGYTAALDVNGIYSIDTGIETINDVDNTGIILGLRLKGAAPGYEFTATADSNTKLSSLGVSAGLVELSDRQGNEYLLELEADDTIGDFINALNSQGITAGINNGVLTIENANITNDYSTKLISALGLNEQTTEILSNPLLTYDTFTSSATTATKDTLLNNLNTSHKVNDGDTIIIGDGTSNYGTVTLTSTETIESLRLKLSDFTTATYGESTGIFTCEGITGGTYDIAAAFEMNYVYSMTGSSLSATGTSIKSSISSNTTISYTVTTVATGTSKLSDCGVDKTWLTLGNNVTGEQETLFLEEDFTFDDLSDLLSAHGVSSGIGSDGVFRLDPGDYDYFIKDGAVEQLGITVPEDFEASSPLGVYAKGVQSTERAYAYGTVTRDMTSCVLAPTGVGQAGINGETGTIVLVRGSMDFDIGVVDYSFETITVTSSTTYNDLNEIFNDYGLNIECNEGIFRITPTEPNSDDGYYIESSDCQFLENLNITDTPYYTRLAGLYHNGLNQCSNTLESCETITGIQDDTTFGMLGLDHDVVFTAYSTRMNIDHTQQRVSSTFSVTSATTVTDFVNWLEGKSFEVTMNNGTVEIVKNGGLCTIDDTIDNEAVLSCLGITSNYKTVSPTATIATYTRLWDIPGLIPEDATEAGEFSFSINGTSYTMSIDSTVEQVLNKFRDNGIDATLSNGQITLESSSSFEVSGEVLEGLLNGCNLVVSGESMQQKEVQYTPAKAQADVNTTLKDLGVTSGDVVLSKGGNNYTLNINETMTLGDLADLLDGYNLSAEFDTDGAFCISNNDDENFSFLKRTGGSNILDVLLVNKNKNYSTNTLQYKTASANATASDSALKDTVTVEKEGRVSAAQYVSLDTKLKNLNITSGSFSLFKDGEKKVIQIEDEETFGTLSTKLHNVGIRLDVDNGYLLFSDIDGGAITSGTNTDTSNISSVLGLYTEVNDVHSSRKVYNVNGNSTLTDSGLFRQGTVTEGTFTIGTAEFEITNTTTLNELITQINSSNNSNATAYWDSVNGDLVIKSRTTGSTLINIEKGTSNFTDVLGFTKSGALNIDYQEVGDNAQFTINGTNFTSTSNTVTSDISRIDGVTINLNSVSNGEKVTLTIEKDSETASNAMQAIVDAYNELIENVDAEVAKSGNLSDQSTLKYLSNQLRSLMINSTGNNGIFNNLSAIGITTQAASSGNIRTDNINTLTFDKDKFTNAFKTNPNALKSLLVGDDTSKGIFTQVEDVLDSTLRTSGYFDSAEKAYNTKLSRLNDKITKQTAYVDRYKERLEKKFQTMDLLISKIQQQYSSFLGS